MFKKSWIVFWLTLVSVLISVHFVVTEGHVSMVTFVLDKITILILSFVFSAVFTTCLKLMDDVPKKPTSRKFLGTVSLGASAPIKADDDQV